jgi:hypothetical protein
MDSIKLKSIIIGSAIAILGQAADAKYDWRAKLDDYRKDLKETVEINKYTNIPAIKPEAPAKPGTILSYQAH